MRRGLLWTALFAGWGARGNEVGASRMSRIGSRMAAGSIVAIAALLCAGGCKQSDPVQAGLDPYSSFVSKTVSIVKCIILFKIVYHYRMVKSSLGFQSYKCFILLDIHLIYRI